MRAHAKAAESGWEWQKLSFVIESQSTLQDSEITKAQSRINSALQSSLQAGFALFQTNLQNDQLQHRRYMLASSGDEAMARTAVVNSLEVLENKGSGDIRCFLFESEVTLSFTMTIIIKIFSSNDKL